MSLDEEQQNIKNHVRCPCHDTLFSKVISIRDVLCDTKGRMFSQVFVVVLWLSVSC